MALCELMRAHFDEIVGESMRRVPAEIPIYAAADPSQLHASAVAGYTAIMADLETGEMGHFADVFHGLAYKRARQGFDVFDLSRVIAIAEQTIRDLAFRFFEGIEERLSVIELCHAVCTSARISILSAFGQANRELLAEADALIEQMSAPVLPISPGVIVLPLVGIVNARRAARIMEALLAGIVAHHASLIILDITGVPVIDTVVADSLVKTARTSQLLGAEVIVVGVAAEVAATMVKLNMDLSGITTLMNLQAGLSYALGVGRSRLQRLDPPR
jgi:rsbT co-antagonist protein RsbR